MITNKPSNVVDLRSETANIFGCEPCPKCGGQCRAMFKCKPGMIQCDNCGFDEPAMEADDDN